MDTPATVLAIGEPLIELADIGNQQLEWTFGGDTFNCLAAIAAAADVEARYLTGLGDDPGSTWFVDFAERLGIDTAACPVVAGKNLGLSWISRHDGDRTFRYWRGESAARAALRSGFDLTGERPSLVVVSSITLAVAGPASDDLIDDLDSIRHDGTIVAFDTNHRPALWPNATAASGAMARALSVADIVHASLDDVAVVWGDDAGTFCERAKAAGAGQVLVTDGPGPITALVDGEQLQQPSKPLDVVDTTGAGDAFFGTYLGRRLENDSPRQALERAVDVASAVVGTRGALTYLAGTAD